MSANLLTIRDIRSRIAGELLRLYEKPEADSLAGIIVRTITGHTGLHQIMNHDASVSTEEAAKMTELCNELMTGKPLQYILGETEFYNCRIKVTPDVLIPRPETEELTDLIIKCNHSYGGAIIDFGTGSGCIAVALAANLKEARVTATDLSLAALNVAMENALINNTIVDFRQDDILNPSCGLPTAGIIVSNPPYVRYSEKKLMHLNVLGFEPHQALFVPDDDPLLFYRALLNIANEILLPGGRVYFEINEAFGKEMADLLGSFGYSGIEIIKDLNGKDRFATGLRQWNIRN